MFQEFNNMYRRYDVNSDNHIEVTHKQDVAGIIKFCEIKRDTQDRYLSKKEEFRHVAEIPVIFVEKWMQENGITTMGKELTEIIYKKINGEYSAFKTTNTHEVYRG